jgi:hypothetical protein
VTADPAAPPPTDIADLADASWLLACRLSGGAPVTAGGRPAYRVNIARGDPQWSFSLLFPAAVAVVDAELGILLRLTSYLGGKPVRRYELQDITTGAGDRVDIPPGMPTVEETQPLRRCQAPSAGQHPAEGRQRRRPAGQAATETAKAARSLLRRMDTRQSHDGPPRAGGQAGPRQPAP